MHLVSANPVEWKKVNEKDAVKLLSFDNYKVWSIYNELFVVSLFDVHRLDMYEVLEMLAFTLVMPLDIEDKVQMMLPAGVTMESCIRQRGNKHIVTMNCPWREKAFRVVWEDGDMFMPLEFLSAVKQHTDVNTKYRVHE